MLHERYPIKTDRQPENATPIAEIMDRGEPEQIIRKKIVYEYKPLYTLAFVICFCMAVWAAAVVTMQLSDNQTARACFQAGNSWQINEQGKSECTRPPTK